MDVAKELVLALKRKNTSHAGYGLQKECEVLVSHVLQNLVKSQLPSLKPNTKNKKDSARYREEGNQHFVMGDDTDAIKCYTLSLAYADSKELMAQAHANRSAALYRIQMYKDCIIDVEAALNLGYPEEKRKNLRERAIKAIEEIKKSLGIDSEDVQKLIKTICRTEDSKDREANTAPQDTIENNNNEEPLKTDSELSNKTKHSSFSNGINGSPTKDINTGKKPRYLEKEGPLKLTYGPSKEVPVLSDGVEISFSSKYGRHLVATKEFQPGDVLTIEDPYAYVIYTQRYYTHCYHCLSRSYSLIPCLKCPLAQYCSEKCRTLSWKMHHRLECPILMLLNNLLNVDHDKIRMLTKILRLLIVVTEGGTKINELREDMKKAESNPDSRTAGFTDSGILDSSSARSALSLATSMTTRPFVGISAFACISALAATLLATQTTFFGKRYKMNQLRDISKFADLKFCGAIMFRACVIMSANCFSIQQEAGIKSGSGLYVSHSLYNHSCVPNTFRHFEGLTLITRALQPIYPGDQIFTSYGACYAHMQLSERKRMIMQDYFFDCDCPACVYDWPTYNEILRNHIGSISKSKELVETLKPFKERLLRNTYDIDAVKSILAILHKKVTQPCEEIIHAEQYLKSYYLDP